MQDRRSRLSSWISSQNMMRIIIIIIIIYVYSCTHVWSDPKWVACANVCNIDYSTFFHNNTEIDCIWLRTKVLCLWENIINPFFETRRRSYWLFVFLKNGYLQGILNFFWHFLASSIVHYNLCHYTQEANTFPERMLYDPFYPSTPLLRTFFLFSA